MELTNKCNLDCIYCYKKATKSRNNDTISLEVIKKLAKSIGSFPSTLVVLEGGEPLLHPNFVEIFAEFKKYFIPVDIITNGTYLKAELVSQIYHMFDKSYDDFQISLDGNNEYNILNRGISSDNVYDGISTLNKFGIVPRINCIVTNKNYLGILDFIKNLNRNFNISSLSFNTPIGSTFKNLILEDRIAEELNKNIMRLSNDLHFKIFGSVIKSERDCANCSYTKVIHMRCTAMRSKICIAANGDIYPCVFMENKVIPFGNIRYNDLQEVWASEESEAFVKSLIMDNQKCINCNNNKYCPQLCVGGQ